MKYLDYTIIMERRNHFDIYSDTYEYIGWRRSLAVAIELIDNIR